MRRWISGFDFILGWFQPKTEMRHFSRILDDLSPEARLMIYDSASRRPISRYFFERTAEAIKPNGRPAPAFEECVRLPSSEISSVPKFAVVHPGSGSPKKCWPLDRFLEVVSFLRRRGFSGTLATGEAEERWEGELRKVALPAGWTWLRRPALPALARLLREATLYLGNDSGVTHLAAACGTNVIAIFRKEFETAWLPFGRTTVLSAENVEQVSLEDVVAAIGRVLSRQSAG
jgi:ADP-heptose:LPS heptosyltransferase